jgi:hypothetical protein
MARRLTPTALAEPVTRPPLTGHIAVVGVAKNCGKTTTLNTLISHMEDHPIGLVSVGIDGESRDYLIGTDKPSIRVYPGQWVVSSREGFERSSARVSFVEPLGFNTPMGPVYLAEVLEPGDVLLSGIRHSGDLRMALDLMTSAGAAPCLIDGAYGRTIGARASLSDGVIVSTGAIVSSSLQEVMEATRSLTHRLTCPEPAHLWQRDLMQRALTEERALLGGVKVPARSLTMRSALTALPRSRKLWGDEIHAIAIPGLVSNRVLEELLCVRELPGGERRALIVEDGTRIQVKPGLMRRFERTWDVYATSRVELLGISYNPSNIAGSPIDAAQFAHALREAYGEELWIFDPMA